MIHRSDVIKFNRKTVSKQKLVGVKILTTAKNAREHAINHCYQLLFTIFTKLACYPKNIAYDCQVDKIYMRKYLRLN